MLPPRRLALFDLDNTLIDRQDTFRRWVAWFVARHGLGEDAAAFMEELDRDGFASREEVFTPVVQRYGLAESVDELVDGYRVGYPGFVEAVPSVATVMARLRAAGWKLAIVTNGPVSQHEKIERAGIGHAFDACCVSDELGIAKPDRRIFAEAARRAGAELGEWDAAWMVGDAPVPDIVGGAAAGCSTIWMHRGRSWELGDVRPDATAGSIEEAVDLLLAQP